MKWSIYLRRVFSPAFCVILIIVALCALMKMPGESLEKQNYFLILLLTITMFYGVIKSWQLDPVGMGRTIVCVLLLGIVNLVMLFSSGWHRLDFLTLIGFLVFVFWLIFNGYSLTNFTTEETEFSLNSLISNIKSNPEAQHLVWEVFKHLAYMMFLGLCFYLFRFEILVLIPFIDALLQGNGLFQIEEFLRGLIVLFVLMYGFMFSLLKASVAWEKLLLCGREK